MPGSQATEEICRKLDELSAEIVLGVNAPADPDRWADSLSGLAAIARSSDQTAIASLADTLAQGMLAAKHSASDDKIRSEFSNSLDQLRAALEEQAANVTETPALDLGDDPELILDFVSESSEHLESIESQVLTLERDASNLEAIHSVFRSFHTIKGLAGFLGFELIQELTHEVETVLDMARNAQLRVTTSVIDVVLASKDYVARWLTCLDASSSRDQAPVRDQQLLDRVRGLMHDGAGSEPSAANPVDDSVSEVPARSSEPKTSARSVKVDTTKLDYLVEMIGEMVIAQSLVRNDPDLRIDGNARLERNFAQLVRITDEIQRTSMAMRMVPVGPLFQKMVRLVRDLSRRFGKDIRVETSGEDVELDRNIVEELADPLMHMIRNAVDHGIETVEQRASSGKKATAVIRLKAFHRSGHIVIEVSDDGRGINRQRVLDRARKNGLIAAHAQISDAECYNLIFQPGFSTAERVTDVSGRGVGMDVVRKQIQKLRGSVDLQSVEGQGSVFSLRLPLTLAIIDGLVIVAGSERYIVPLASVKEIFRPRAGQVSTVEGRAEVASVRDRLAPVLRLYERFGIEPKTRDPLESVFVMAETEDACFCMMVDELVGKQEVVIKSLGSVFRDVPGIAGGAILGDGHVGLILDLHTLFNGNRDV